MPLFWECLPCSVALGKLNIYLQNLTEKSNSKSCRCSSVVEHMLSKGLGSIPRTEIWKQKSCVFLNRKIMKFRTKEATWPRGKQCGLILSINNFYCVTSVQYEIRGLSLTSLIVSLGLGVPRKPTMRLSQKISLESQKNCKRKPASSETASPPKRSQPGEVKTSSALKTLRKNGQAPSVCAKQSMTLRAQGPAEVTTKINVEGALTPVRGRVRSSVVPTVVLTPKYIER